MGFNSAFKGLNVIFRIS